MTSDEAAKSLEALRPSAEIIRFGKALSDADLLGDGWAYFLEKPWKWADEYMEWEHRYKQDSGDGATWDEFVAAVE